MEKLEKQKPKNIKKTSILVTFIVSSSLFLLSLIGTIIIVAMPFTKGEYFGEMSIEGSSIHSTIILKKGDECIIESRVGAMSYRQQGRYYVHNGYLYVSQEDEGFNNFEKIGKINSRKVTVAEYSEDLGVDAKYVFTCKTTNTFYNINIAVMIVSGIGVATSVALYIFLKKKKPVPATPVIETTEQ